MLIPLHDVWYILEQYKYLLLFPIAAIEGPIIMIISGFLAFLGLLNIYAAYGLLVLGDLTGDALHYVIGKYWRMSKFVKRYGHFLGYSEKSEKYLRGHFEKHRIKTIISAKFFHGIGTPIQITAGIAGIDWVEYMLINLALTLPKTLILVVIGYYIGDSYVKIDSYLNGIAITMISLLVLVTLYVTSKRFAKKYLLKIDAVE